MIEIKLSYPVKTGSTEIAEVSVRRPKVKDMLVSDRTAKTDSEREIALFARLTGLNPEVIGEFDYADYKKVQKVYEGFLSMSESESGEK